jgi:hypothetical protein
MHRCKFIDFRAGHTSVYQNPLRLSAYKYFSCKVPAWYTSSPEGDNHARNSPPLFNAGIFEKHQNVPGYGG